jgi:hypothetical protein
MDAKTTMNAISSQLVGCQTIGNKRKNAPQIVLKQKGESKLSPFVL